MQGLILQQYQAYNYIQKVGALRDGQCWDCALHSEVHSPYTIGLYVMEQVK